MRDCRHHSSNSGGSVCVTLCRFSAVVRQDVAPPPSNGPKPKQVPPTTTTPQPPRCPLPSTGGATRMVTEGHSYSAVAEHALEPRPPGKGGSDPASGNSSHSQPGTNSSLSGNSSQEMHTVHTTDMDSMNPKGGWTSQESSGLSLSGDNSYLEKGPLSAAALEEGSQEEGSQESLGQATMEEDEGEGEEMKVEDRLQETIQVTLLGV